jgi:hypothetical protein
VLAFLTLPEKVLIVLVFPRTYIVKLFHKASGSGAQGGGAPDKLYDGLSGNVCSLDMPHEQLNHLLHGRLLPHPLAILPNMISIGWVGAYQFPPLYLRGLFGVSCTRV